MHQYPVFLRQILILFPHLRLPLPVVSFLQILRLKFAILLSSPNLLLSFFVKHVSNKYSFLRAGLLYHIKQRVRVPVVKGGEIKMCLFLEMFA
jgi:hypothetical protein